VSDKNTDNRLQHLAGKVDGEAVEKLVRRIYPDASEREIFARAVLAATFLNGGMDRKFLDSMGTELLRQDFFLLVAAVKLKMEKDEREGPRVQ
jgi:hypothetical protein